MKHDRIKRKLEDIMLELDSMIADMGEEGCITDRLRSQRDQIEVLYARLVCGKLRKREEKLVKSLLSDLMVGIWKWRSGSMS